MVSDLLVNIGIGNVLSLVGNQAITWTMADLWIGPGQMYNYF